MRKLYEIINSAKTINGNTVVINEAIVVIDVDVRSSWCHLSIVVGLSSSVSVFLCLLTLCCNLNYLRCTCIENERYKTEKYS